MGHKTIKMWSNKWREILKITLKYSKWSLLKQYGTNLKRNSSQIFSENLRAYWLDKLSVHTNYHPRGKLWSNGLRLLLTLVLYGGSAAGSVDCPQGHQLKERGSLPAQWSLLRSADNLGCSLRTYWQAWLWAIRTDRYLWCECEPEVGIYAYTHIITIIIMTMS